MRAEAIALWLAVGSAFLAAVGTFFSGYQTLLTRDALLVTRLSTIQVKQVQYCEDLIAATNALFRAFDSSEVKMTILPSYESIETPEQNFAQVARTVTETFRTALEGAVSTSGKEVAQAADMLALYASPETAQELELIGRDAFLLSILFAANAVFAALNAPPDTRNFHMGSPEDIADRMKTAMAPLRQKCQNVFLGQAQGLI